MRTGFVLSWYPLMASPPAAVAGDVLPHRPRTLDDAGNRFGVGADALARRARSSVGDAEKARGASLTHARSHEVSLLRMAQGR